MINGTITKTRPLPPFNNLFFETTSENLQKVEPRGIISAWPRNYENSDASIHTITELSLMSFNFYLTSELGSDNFITRNFI